jgi:hypothetical protein
MKIYDATKIKKNKKHALLLGTGNSINQISREQYIKIKESFDIWGINNFFLHNYIVPDFLHFEIKADINGEILPRILEEKKDAYKNTVFIADIATRERDLPYRFLNTDLFVNFYSYNRVDRLNPDGTYILDGKYKPHKDVVQITHGKSNSKILDIMVRSGYEKIFFCGIDLNDCNYFWTDNPVYEKLNIPDSMHWCGKLRTLKGVPSPYKKEGNHPTSCLLSFFKDILYFNNVTGYNLSNTSELKKVFKTITIEEMINCGIDLNEK